MPRQFIFGYGSLVATHAGKAYAPHLSRLTGFRRGWGVAMDNRRDIPGYKYYLEAESGRRPDVFVTFLDIMPKPSAQVNGLVIPVSVSELADMDRRERNYQRLNVTGAVHPPVEGMVWAYAGLDEARVRCDQGVSEGVGVICQRYEQMVRNGFASFSDDEACLYDESTEPTKLPRMILQPARIPE